MGFLHSFRIPQGYLKCVKHRGNDHSQYRNKLWKQSDIFGKIHVFHSWHRPGCHLGFPGRSGWDLLGIHREIEGSERNRRVRGASATGKWFAKYYPCPGPSGGAGECPRRSQGPQGAPDPKVVTKKSANGKVHCSLSRQIDSESLGKSAVSRAHLDAGNPRARHSINPSH